MTIGETLGAARQRIGLSVDELSERTRVRDHIIRAIEQDEFAECGGAFYARGHIRTLARSLAVDEEPLVEEFDSEHAATIGLSVNEIFTTRRKAAAAERPRVRWVLLMAAACVIAAAAVAVYGYVNDDESGVHTASATGPDRSSENPGRAAPSDDETRDHTSGDRMPDEGAEDTTRSDDDATDNADADEDADDVTLHVQAEERTWLSVSDSSGADLFTGIMDRGDERDWSDEEELNVVLGNTRGVAMEVNDEKQESPGGSGGVSRLTLTPEGVK